MTRMTGADAPEVGNSSSHACWAALAPAPRWFGPAVANERATSHSV